ncbi:MAG: vWA domain-containing protein [Rhizobiaceae bacterium]
MLRSINGFRTIFAAQLMFVSLQLAPPVSAADQSKVMVVLDASGSMWGQIDGKSKIVIARQAIRDLMKDWEPSIQVGLSAYGHRRKGDCSDIQTLQPVGPLEPDALMQAVNSIRPKGKTPLSEAVRRAAEELKYTEDKATVVLVSDGKETCDADPCALGNELEKLGVDFTTHVIGFDVKKSETQGLQCLADNTGGLFINASNPSTLLVALTTTVEEVKKEQKKATPKKPRVVAAKPPEVKKPVSKPGHRFTAFLNAGGSPLDRGMRWDVYEGKAGIDGKRKRVIGNYEARPNFKLKPGAYKVVAKHGNAASSLDLVVQSESEAKLHEIVLNAERLVLEGALSEGMPALRKGLRWDVYQEEKNIDGKRQRVNGNYDRRPVFTLTAGRYHVVGKHGNARVATDVEIKAGQREELSLVFNAGLAALSAKFAETGPPVKRGMRWDVYEAEKDISGKRTRINGNYDTNPTFILPEGRYHVVAKRGNAVRSSELEITAGKRSELNINLSAGLLALSASLGDKAEFLKKGMRFDIYSVDKNLEGKRKRYNGTYDAQPNFTLTEGKFLVVAKNGNARHEQEVSISAGKRAEVRLNLKAGQVRLDAKDAGGSPVRKGLRWDTYAAEKDIDGKRRRISGNSNKTPLFTLNEGKYFLIVKHNKKSTE